METAELGTKKHQKTSEKAAPATLQIGLETWLSS